MSLQHLAGSAYALPGDNVRARPWLGVVMTPDGSVLIDSGNGPLHARELQAALDAVGAPPVAHILLTHHHWDHVFGNASFPGVHIVAHELTQEHLEIMAAEPWSADYVAAKQGIVRGNLLGRLMNQAVPDWTRFRAVPAHTVFEEQYELRLGGATLALEHVGGPHEPDQCIVHVQPGNVLFLGDAAYGRGPRGDWGHAALIAMMESLLARGADWYVEGHRPPADEQTFRQRMERLSR